MQTAALLADAVEALGQPDRRRRLALAERRRGDRGDDHVLAARPLAPRAAGSPRASPWPWSGRTARARRRRCPRSWATSMIGRGVTDRAISRSDGKLIGLLRRGRRRARSCASGASVGAWRSAARIRWVSRSALVSGPTPPGHRRDRRGDLDRRREVDVADDAAVDDVDPDVDDDRARLEHRAGDEAGLAGGDDDDVGPARRGAARSRVREWQTVTVASSLTSRNAAGIPTTGDRPMTTASLPCDLDPGPAQDLDRGVGGRRQEAVVAEAEEAGVERMDAVDVLGRIDRVDDRAQADRRRQRHLDDDAVDRRVVVELADGGGRRGASVASPSSSTKPASMPTLAQPRRIRSR